MKMETFRFNAGAALDYKTGRLEAARNVHMGFVGNAGALLRTAIICMIMTITIELLIAIPFKIKPLEPVLIADIITQIFLHIILI